MPLPPKHIRVPYGTLLNTPGPVPLVFSSLPHPAVSRPVAPSTNLNLLIKAKPPVKPPAKPPVSPPKPPVLVPPKPPVMMPPRPPGVPPVITASPPPAPPVMKNYQAVHGRGGSYPHGAKGSLPYFPFSEVYFIDFGRWGHNEYYDYRYYSLDLNAWTIETKISFSLIYQQADYQRELGWTPGPVIDINQLNGKRPYWG